MNADVIHDSLFNSVVVAAAICEDSFTIDADPREAVTFARFSYWRKNLNFIHKTASYFKRQQSIQFFIRFNLIYAAEQT